MIKINKIFKNRIFLHILFWLTYWMICMFVFGSPSGEYLREFFKIGLRLPVQIISVYLTLYYLLPKYLLRHKSILFSFYFLLMTLLLVLIQRIIDVTIYGKLFYPDTYQNWRFFDIIKIASRLIWIYLINAIALAIKLSKHYFQKNIENSKIIQEKLQAELKLLRSQVHPHFLFNTLNNLYSLALVNSKKTAGAILKLSEILHYIIYDCNTPSISLEKEIKLIKSYIALERLRYGKRLKINFNIEGKYIDKMIPPMLILPFVENAFKHGISKHLNEGYIDIILKVNNGILSFEVINTKVEKDIQPTDIAYTNGIGLKNVKKRLNLFYSDNYILKIDESKDKYRIYLEINLLKQNLTLHNESKVFVG